MIAEIVPECYDAEGTKVFRPDTRRRSGFKPTFPAGRFLSQPLKYCCTDLSDMQRFLSKCEYVFDEEQFGQKDYWEPPDQFEETKKGDCEDFALWAWRQLIHMGYSSRFVVASAFQYGEGHAWVTFNQSGRTFILEAVRRKVGLKEPRLSVLRYKPKFSISWNGETLSYFEHQHRQDDLPARLIAPLVGEWLFFWTRWWLMLPIRFSKRLVAAFAGQNQSRTT